MFVTVYPRNFDNLIEQINAHKITRYCQLQVELTVPEPSRLHRFFFFFEVASSPELRFRKKYERSRVECSTLLLSYFFHTRLIFVYSTTERRKNCF